MASSSESSSVGLTHQLHGILDFLQDHVKKEEQSFSSSFQDVLQRSPLSHPPERCQCCEYFQDVLFTLKAKYEANEGLHACVKMVRETLVTATKDELDPTRRKCPRLSSEPSQGEPQERVDRVRTQHAPPCPLSKKGGLDSDQRTRDPGVNGAALRPFDVKH